MSASLTPTRPGSRYTDRVRAIVGLYSRAVEEEADGRRMLSGALAEGVHQLLKLCRALDLEEDFGGVVGDLDVEVLGLLLLRGRSIVAAAAAAAVVGRGIRGWRAGHCGWSVVFCRRQ